MAEGVPGRISPENGAPERGGAFTKAALGLGGNVGDVRTAMRAALAMLDERADTQVTAVSSLYRTPPWGMTDQPDFLNCAALVETALDAEALLDACLAAERALKRERAGATRWGPRPIDIDILTFGDAAFETAKIAVPHPRLTGRAFVLLPLAEIAPDLTVGARTVREWADEADAAGIERVEAPGWWRG